MATASRQIFAFARDNAVPFSPWFSKVSPKWNLPINSIFFTFCMTILLSLINLGSATALNSITSLATNALFSSYICSIGCMIWRRATNQPLLPSPFRLGRRGLPINIFPEISLIFAFVLYALLNQWSWERRTRLGLRPLTIIQGFLPYWESPRPGEYELEHFDLQGGGCLFPGLLCSLWKEAICGTSRVREEAGMIHDTQWRVWGGGVKGRKPSYRDES